LPIIDPVPFELAAFEPFELGLLDFEAADFGFAAFGFAAFLAAFGFDDLDFDFVDGFAAFDEGLFGAFDEDRFDVWVLV
jgi:hypothetical protein